MRDLNENPTKKLCETFITKENFNIYFDFVFTQLSLSSFVIPQLIFLYIIIRIEKKIM